MKNTTIDLTADVIDVRDIIERYEELAEQELMTDAEKDERAWLLSILECLKGEGGDEQWRGDWYPLLLIRDDYFPGYCKELCEDIGDIPRDIPHYIEIDWKATAKNIRVDYSPLDIGPSTYWYR